MTRRAIKKILRKAEEAYLHGRLEEAEDFYRRLMTGFETVNASLLDRSVCLFFLIEVLHAQDRPEEALELCNAAVDILSGAELQEHVAA